MFKYQYQYQQGCFQIMGDTNSFDSRSDIENIQEGIKRIYLTKEFSDVKFLKGEDKEFKAHKLVLAARSSKFQRLFFDPNALDEFLIENGVTETGFEILLCFIYTDKIGTDEKASIIDAWFAAKSYEQSALQTKCEKIFESWSICQKEVWDLLEAAIRLDIPILKIKCVEFVKNNLNTLIASDSFLKISFECMNTILDEGILKNLPGLEQISKVMAWAANRPDWKDNMGKVSYIRIREELLKTTPPILGKLGIKSMNMTEIGKVAKEYKGLITADEFLALNFYHEGDDSELPEWCKS